MREGEPDEHGSLSQRIAEKSQSRWFSWLPDALIIGCLPAMVLLVVPVFFLLR